MISNCWRLVRRETVPFPVPLFSAAASLATTTGSVTRRERPWRTRSPSSRAMASAPDSALLRAGFGRAAVVVVANAQATVSQVRGSKVAQWEKSRK